MAETLDDLRLLIRSRHPIITIETNEEGRAVARVRQAAESFSYSCYVWNLVDGLQELTRTGAKVPLTGKPAEVLANIIALDWPAVFILADFCVHLREPMIQRLFRKFAEGASSHLHTVVLIDAVIDLPESLSRLAVPFEFSLPGEPELEIIVRETFKEHGRYWKIRSELTASQLTHLVFMLRGLTAEEAKLAVSRVILDDNCLNAADIPRLLSIKRELVDKGGVLDYIEPGVDLDGIGGLEKLKNWLIARAGAMTPQARDFGLESPRGILLLGVQGCGKSAACKAVAAAWHLPLLRLDPGCLYDKFVGESERQLRRAIQQAESMAPIILWIDEIEKAFASAGAESADGGLSKRMFGTLLTWLQDHKSPIFCAATANDISALPPELVRKGRFDEVFFVDLPNGQVRQQIFAIHLRKRKRKPEQFDLPALADASEGFSGAEIEQVVISGLYAAFGAHRDLTQADILSELRGTRPLSVTMAERVAGLRAWAAERCISAD
jgi:AAA+ superfamily predicted ATPase